MFKQYCLVILSHYSISIVDIKSLYVYNTDGMSTIKSGSGSLLMRLTGQLPSLTCLPNVMFLYCIQNKVDKVSSILIALGDKLSLSDSDTPLKCCQYFRSNFFWKYSCNAEQCENLQYQSAVQVVSECSLFYLLIESSQLSEYVALTAVTIGNVMTEFR